MHEQFNRHSGDFSPVQFVTALIARVELATGEISIVNAGHPVPYLLRDGELRPVPMDHQLPLGLAPGVSYVDQKFSLRPGGPAVLLPAMASPTRAPTGARRSVRRGWRRSCAPRRTSRRTRPCGRLLHAVSEYQQGNFRDDATALCLDWR